MTSMFQDLGRSPSVSDERMLTLVDIGLDGWVNTLRAWGLPGFAQGINPSAYSCLASSGALC